METTVSLHISNWQLVAFYATATEVHEQAPRGS